MAIALFCCLFSVPNQQPMVLWRYGFRVLCWRCRRSSIVSPKPFVCVLHPAFALILGFLEIIPIFDCHRWTHQRCCWDLLLCQNFFATLAIGLPFCRDYKSILPSTAVQLDVWSSVREDETCVRTLLGSIRPKSKSSPLFGAITAADCWISPSWLIGLLFLKITFHQYY